ncbi:MAG: hypothetical protein COB37_04615 [Kordiimonadales bacterium]|nr:MAG: hypothetical protein COB37_04615 [Kordiimonadales bacterium]
MLKNMSLRHLVPLMFLAGSLLLVVFFYLLGFPAAQEAAKELSKQETYNTILAQQSRFIELLIQNDPDKLSKEIYFINTDPDLERMIIVDENQLILYANRSRLVGVHLKDSEINTGKFPIPFPENQINDIILIDAPENSTLISGLAPLRYRRGSETFNRTLIIVRDYAPLATAITDIAAIPSKLLATVMLMLSILAVLLLHFHLGRRLGPLLLAAANLAKGTNGARAKLGGSDEFAQIGRAFDMMAERIEIKREGLEKAMAEAEKGSDAKNKFLGYMSHEIQTPLSGVLGFVDLLKETELNDESRLYVRSLESASRTLSGLIGDLLETSRLEAGTVKPVSETFCLNSLLQEILDSVLPRSMQKGLSVRVISNENEPIWLESDQSLFRQILLNLLGNAVQFTEEGQITIAISSYPVLGNVTALSISVIDTGIGIAPDEISKLFERFYRSVDSRAQAKPGSGVGLSICRELAQLLGGDITIESELDQGSTFTFNIEVPGSKRPDDQNYTALWQREQLSQNVLLVENSEITRNLITSILSKWGHNVRTCSNGIDAIQVMKDQLIYPDSKPISLVILDLHLAGLDGFETVLEIRGLDSNYECLPIIATTTQKEKDVKERCLNSGFDGFIGKPVDRKKMAEEVFRLTRLATRKAG